MGGTADGGEEGTVTALSEFPRTCDFGAETGKVLGNLAKWVTFGEGETINEDTNFG